MFKSVEISSKVSKVVRSAALLSLSALSLSLVGTAANAAPSIANGTFTSTTSPTSDSFLIPFYTVNSWTLGPNPTSGVNCIDAGGLTDICGTGYNLGEKVWVNPGVSPAGGNAFVSVPNVAAAFSQTVSGLTVGTTYGISFYQAAGEIYAEGAPTTDDWLVSLGSSSATSPAMNVASESDSPWQLVTVDFTATATSESLSFLAQGVPVGAPPADFLSGVSISVAVPEPASAAVFGLSVLGLLGLYRTRSRASDAI